MGKNLTIETAHRIVDLEKIIKEQNDFITLVLSHISSPIETFYNLRFFENGSWTGGTTITKEDVEVIIDYRRQEIEKYQEELDSLTKDEE